MKNDKRHKQIMIPEVAERESEDLERQIDAHRKISATLIDKVIENHSVEAKKNSIANIKWVNGAISAILHINEISQGIGTITLNRALYNEHEKVNSKFKAIQKNINEKTGFIEKSSTEKTVMSELFNPIDWNEYDVQEKKN